MDTKWKIVTVALVAAVFGFLIQSHSPIGAMIWPPAEDGPEPAGVQLALLLVVGVIEALAFGVGIAFLVWGWPLVRRAPVSRNLAVGAYAAIAWALVSWVPHTSLHIANGHALAGLIAIEYAFHVTLVIGAVVLAAFFVGILRAAPAPQAAPEKKAMVASLR